jgi:single-stranded DNA-binding protein
VTAAIEEPDMGGVSGVATRDLNLAVIAGRVASDPEVDMVEGGSRRLRMLVTVKAESPRRRIDVIPVTMWDPPDELVNPGLQASTTVMVVGAVQRHVHKERWGTRSRLEVIAASVIDRSWLDRRAIGCD